MKATPPPSIIADNRNSKHTKKYNRLKHLGRGGFANVYSVRSLDTSRVYACKVINKKLLVRSEHRRKLISEVSLHQLLVHRNIVKFETCFEDSSNVYILLECCPNNSLMELLYSRRKLTEYEVRYFMLQILNGIKYLHSQSIIHRDLKLGNLLLDSSLNIKICDFGLATRLEYSGARKTTICGTPNYIAPEILNGRKSGVGHSYEVDIWSLGVIMFTLLCGKPPFETRNIEETYKRIKKLYYKFPSHSNVSKPAKLLISKILTIQPNERPNLNEIENNQFFMKHLIPKKLPTFILKREPKKHELFDNNHLNLDTKIDKIDESSFLYIIKIVDYAKKYGIGYILSNCDTGIYFNDSTKILLNKDKTNIIYFDENDCIQYLKFNKFPKNLHKKVTLLKHFNSYLWSNNNDENKSNSEQLQNIKNKCVYRDNNNNNNNNKNIYLKKWIRTKHAILFRLSNKTVQVNFNDNTKLIFNDNSYVMYKNKNGKINIYSLKQLYDSSITNTQKDLKKRFKYTQELLKKIANKSSSSSSSTSTSSSSSITKH